MTDIIGPEFRYHPDYLRIALLNYETVEKLKEERDTMIEKIKRKKLRKSILTITSG
jgi:hypothetical protein